MMKSIIVFAAFAATALAQSISIGAPPFGTTISPGQNITVEVDKPRTLSGSLDVAIVISMFTITCHAPTCPGNPHGINHVLYAGPYQPINHPEDSHFKPPYQNFTVTVPDSFVFGDVALLNIQHWFLEGADFSDSQLETKNATYTVTPPPPSPPTARAIGGRILA